jgi:hypothetical protein
MQGGRLTVRYSRWTPREQVPVVVDHVRAHLSAVCTPDDNPATLADDVHVEQIDQDGGVLVVGELDAQPDAPYLMPGFYPDQEAAANPLSVRSVEDQP